MAKQIVQMNKEELLAHLSQVRPNSSFEGTKAELQAIALKIESVDQINAKYPALGVDENSPAELLDFILDAAQKDEVITEQSGKIVELTSALAEINEKLAAAEKEANSASSSTGGVVIRFEGVKYRIIHGVQALGSENAEKISKHTPDQIAKNAWLLKKLIEEKSGAVVEEK